MLKAASARVLRGSAGQVACFRRMASQPAEHPAFARIYAKAVEYAEAHGGAEHRRRLLDGLSGRVIEVGAGSGANFAFYPDGVSKVLAVEPGHYLRALAQEAARRAPVAVEVVDGVAEQLPGAEGSFDAGVTSLVLCTVPDQAAALAELFRVIQPGGELRFYEHVVSHRRWEARIQRLADATFWPHVAGGCHLARDTKSAIEQAGFEIEACERFGFSFAPLLPPDPHVLGRARRPAGAQQSDRPGT
jgi:ubiquinone/menaquinone biosynthesis C-methylase UbiE